jgi:hypothetical protein
VQPVAGERGTPVVPYLCAAVHAAALGLMALVLAPGTEAVPEVAARARYVAAHGVAWTGSWLVWMASACTLLAFYAWWGRRVTSMRVTAAVVALAAVGAACDLSGEWLYAFEMPRSAAAAAAGDAGALAAFSAAQATATALTALWANGFYTAAGLALTLLSPRFRGWRAAVPWTVWVAGGALSLAGAMGWGTAMAMASGVLFPAFIALSVLAPHEIPAPGRAGGPSRRDGFGRVYGDVRRRCGGREPVGLPRRRRRDGGRCGTKGCGTR